jgi:hypothetical protein
MRIHKKTTINRGVAKKRVGWLNQALCFFQSLYLIIGESLRNPHLRVAAKRIGNHKDPTQQPLN